MNGMNVKMERANGMNAVAVRERPMPLWRVARRATSLPPPLFRVFRGEGHLGAFQLRCLGLFVPTAAPQRAQERRRGRCREGDNLRPSQKTQESIMPNDPCASMKNLRSCLLVGHVTITLQ